MKREVFFKMINEKDPSKSYYNKVHADSGMVIGNITLEDKKTRLIAEPFGNPTFDTLIDDVMSAISYICHATLDANKGTSAARNEIYTRAVQAFSFIMDEFNPDAKDYKKDLSEELKALEETTK